MKIFSNRQWDESHTDLSKYLLRRFAQLVDTDEVISNRHPTTNGLILLEELYEVSTICLQRWKNHFRLRTLLSECADQEVKTSVVNDPILNKYFHPAIDDVRRWKRMELSTEVATEIQRGALKYAMAVRPEYVERIRGEFDVLDLSSENFDTVAREIDKLLTALVPQVLYDGHSMGFLQRVPRNLGTSRLQGLMDRLFAYFTLSDDPAYHCFVVGDETLDAQMIEFLGANPERLPASSFHGKEETRDGYAFEAVGKDPFSALRNSATRAFRKLSLREPEINPETLRPFWTESYYKGRSGKYVKYNFVENSDPIISTLRANTLRETLDNVARGANEVPENTLQQLEEPLYFYHLARAVPSVENSYILLWTALEALMGLRTNQADIEIVQTNVAQAIALGAVGRRVNSTVQRLRTLGAANKWRYLGPHDSSEYARMGLCRWIVWLTDRSLEKTAEDPFEVLQTDPLLAKQYRNINETWDSLGVLRDIILTSERNLRYQLDRLYLTRNTIIHSGHFGRTGTYLWIHLEWYVGKILAQSMSALDEVSGQLNADPRDLIFGELQGQYGSTIDYLGRHSHEPITLDRLVVSGVTRFPALCF